MNDGCQDTVVISVPFFRDSAVKAELRNAVAVPSTICIFLCSSRVVKRKFEEQLWSKGRCG